MIGGSDGRSYGIRVNGIMGYAMAHEKSPSDKELMNGQHFSIIYFQMGWELRAIFNGQRESLVLAIFNGRRDA